MPVNKKQLHRLVKLVAMLKENRYPNSKSFVEELRKSDLFDNRNIACTAKTIQRDIKALKEEFGAPIGYNAAHNGYYLKNHGWDFPCPLFEEHEMLASVLGARIAEDIFPEPLKSSIRQAVDFQLTNNNPDFLDTIYLKSMMISPGLNVTISPEIFNTVFEAWKKHIAIDIVYKDASDKRTERRVDPHVLAFQDSAWFIKGYCHKTGEFRVFAIHRILEAKLTGKTFEPDKDLTEDVRQQGPFSYHEVKNIKLACSSCIEKYLVEQPLHKDQRIENESGSEFTLFIPAMWELYLIHFILSHGGDVRLLEPKSLRKKIAKSAERILNLHRG